MTVKEALSLLDNANEVSLSWDGTLVNFNFRNSIEVDVWGDYVVRSISAYKEGAFELALAAQPVKREVRA